MQPKFCEVTHMDVRQLAYNIAHKKISEFLKSGLTYNLLTSFGSTILASIIQSLVWGLQKDDI